MIKEFKEFISRGNVIDLAVAVIIGGAFGLIVTSLVDDVVMPLVAAVIGQPSFDDLTFALNGTTIFYGKFLTSLVNFLIIAFVIFLVVKGINAAQEKAKALRSTTEEEIEEELDAQTQLLTEIRDLLSAGSSKN
jgi:large conductance mechanosensitive channel